MSEEATKSDRIVVPETYLPEESTDQNVLSGIIFPSDIRIRLVRAETVTLDTVLSLIYSSLLTVFGVFLGIMLTKGQLRTGTEVAAVVFFGFFSMVILVWWTINKVKQHDKGVSLPTTILQKYEDDNA